MKSFIQGPKRDAEAAIAPWMNAAESRLPISARDTHSASCRLLTMLASSRVPTDGSIHCQTRAGSRGTSSPAFPADRRDTGRGDWGGTTSTEMKSVDEIRVVTRTGQLVLHGTVQHN